MLDAVVALLLILLLAPVMLAVAVKLDGGPVLFRQTRVGKGGTELGMLKFRSVVLDAETRLDELATRNEGTGPLFTTCSDPRVTRVGCVIRRYSLDELPQLFNVVAGTMRLVGPRPALRRAVDAYCPLARRLAVKPGLWQMSGPAATCPGTSPFASTPTTSSAGSRCSTCRSSPAPPVRSPAPGAPADPGPRSRSFATAGSVHGRARPGVAARDSPDDTRRPPWL